MATAIDAAMKPFLRTRRARGPPSRPEQGSTPAHRFHRFGKHYRAGLQALERVSIVLNQGSEVSGQSVEQRRGCQAAKCLYGFEGPALAATRKRQPHLSRQQVDFKHEGGVRFAKELIADLPNGEKPGYSVCRAGTAPPLARPHAGLIRWLGPWASSKKAPWAAIAPLSGAALVLQLVPRAATPPAD
jgi:hypothetical protein